MPTEQRRQSAPMRPDKHLCPKCECPLSISVRDVKASEDGALVSVTVTCETGGCFFETEVSSEMIISAALGHR